MILLKNLLVHDEEHHLVHPIFNMCTTMGLQIHVIGQVNRNPPIPSLFAKRKEEGDVLVF